MTTKRLLIAVMTVFFCLASGTPALAADPRPQGAAAQSAGKISALLPIAKLVRGQGNAAVISEAKKDDQLIWQDLVKTEKGGRARITLNDNSILSVGSQSELRITKHDARSNQTSLELTYGRVRAEVTKVTREGGKFEVKTPTAVAGVIGTDFGTISGPGETTFICISGKVDITNPAVPGGVQCGPGETTTVTQGNPPTPPKPATPEQILQLIMDTEPAEVSALAPSGVLPGMTINASASGVHLEGVNKVDVSGEGVDANLQPGGTQNALTLQLGVAANAAPGPRTITLSKPAGDPAVAVFMVMEAPAPPVNPKAAYGQLLMNEGQLASAQLQGLYESGVGFAQQQYDDVVLANAKLPQPLDLAQPQNELNTRLAQLEQQYQASLQTINNAVSQAGGSFNQQYDQLRGQFPGPDEQLPPAFWTQIANLFEQTLKTLQAQLSAAHAAMAAAVNGSNLFAQQMHDNWMKMIGDAALAQNAVPVPAIKGPQTVEAGAVAAFDGSGSKPGPSGNIQSYLWEVCQPDSSCTPISGFGSEDVQFNLSTCALAPGIYPVRLTVTDTNNVTANSLSAVEVLTPGYESPAQRVYTLAGLYGALQPESFLSLFDSSFAGYSVLQENIRRTFEQLASISINLRSMQESINCSDGGAGVATVRTDWEAKYSFKTDPSLVVNDAVKQVTVRLLREPGRGWFITDLQGDNGLVQGAPPGPGESDEPTPDLQVLSVAPDTGPLAAPQRGSTATPLVAVPPGANTFTATIANSGPVPLTTPMSVRFTFGGASTDVPLPVPLAAGAQASVSATIDVNVPAGSDATLEVTVNPTCALPEVVSDCANNTFVLTFTVGPPDYVITVVRFSGHPADATGANALQRFATHDLLITVSNIGLGSVAETLTVTAVCFPQPDCDPDPEIATFAAPAAGTSTVITIPLGTLDIPSGAYTGEATLQPSPIETNPNNNTFVATFEVFDFTIGVTPAFTPQNIAVDGVAGTLPQDVTGTGSSAPVPVPIAVSGMPAGVSVLSAGSVDSGSSQVMSISTTTTSLAGTDATLTITGTRDGVFRTATHDLRFYSAAIQNRTTGQPGETAGSPLQIEKTIRTDIEFQLVGDFIAPLGTAVVSVDPNAQFTVLSLDAGTATPNGANFMLALQPSATAAETVTQVTIRAAIPNTSPAREVTYTLFVLPFSRPDLTITAIAGQGGRDFAANPWLSGEPVDIDVTVENVGGGASQSTTFEVSLNGAVVGTGNVGPLAAGANTVVTVHCVAPDPLFSSTFSNIFAELALSPLETNGSNQFSPFVTISTSDWSVQVAPVSLTALTNTDVVPSVRRSLDNSIVPNTLTWVPGNVSTLITQTIGAGSPPTVNVAAGAALDGEYFSQVIAQMKDGAAVTAQRLGTVNITVGTFAPPTVLVVSSVSNHVNTSPLQLNGPLPEKFDIQNNNIDVVSMDLLISDSDALTTTPNFIQNTTPGVAHQLTVAADISPGGGISTGSTTSTVSAVAVQPVIILGEVKNTPVGTQNTTLYYDVGDVFANTNFCYDLPPGASSNEVVNIQASSGFNLPSVDWQWQNLPAGITVDVPSGNGTLSAGSYGSFNFQFSNISATPVLGYTDITFAITIQNANGTATRLQTVTISRSLVDTCSAIGSPVRNGAGHALPGVWVIGRAVGAGGTSLGSPAASAALPDVRIDARDISFAPSLPRPGDTVAVRFRLSNTGDSDAVGVPVSLSVEGRIVATDTFDVRKGSATLAGLEWNTAEGGRTQRMMSGGRRATVNAAGTAMLMVDPAGTVQQKSTQEKSAVVPHLSLAEGATATAGGGFGRQRITVEVAEGECVGLRLDSGSAGMCGSADLELTVGDLAAATYMMSAPEGIAALGAVSPDAAPTASVSFAAEAAALPGNSYAVRLRNGGVAVVSIEVVRNPQQLGTRTAKAFGTGGRRAGMGGNTGAVETGDVAGAGARNAVLFRISYRSTQ